MKEHMRWKINYMRWKIISMQHQSRMTVNQWSIEGQYHEVKDYMGWKIIWSGGHDVLHSDLFTECACATAHYVSQNINIKTSNDGPF